MPLPAGLTKVRLPSPTDSVDLPIRTYAVIGEGPEALADLILRYARECKATVVFVDEPKMRHVELRRWWFFRKRVKQTWCYAAMGDPSVPEAPPKDAEIRA